MLKPDIFLNECRGKLEDGKLVNTQAFYPANHHVEKSGGTRRKGYSGNDNITFNSSC